MTQKELNEYILHYITEDKTRSAIMLTAPWGTGKSYYIQNELIPFLRDNGNHKCIVVSLYGLNELAEISRNIYLEMRNKKVANLLNDKILKKLPQKLASGSKEIGNASCGYGKTVLKGLAGKIGIDIKISDKDLAKIYSSIDLSDKLIAFEDLERSKIDINEVLGYVNNLVEQDGVKVLLVANEDEIMKYEPLVIDDANNEGTAKLYDEITNHKNRDFTESTEEYLKTKEKAVSDTINFEEDYYVAVKNIINSFESGYLSRFAEDNEITDIVELLYLHRITNLRTFIFACQKVVDVLRIIKPKATEDSDFIKTIFYSIIIFSNRLKNGFEVHWKGNDVFSVELSWEKFPLFRFCYDYIIYHTFDKSKVEESKEALAELRLYDKDKSNSDPYIMTINNWWVKSEKEIVDAVNNITKRLENEDDISFHVYGYLAFNLVRIKNVIGCDIEKAKGLLVKNLHNKGNEINADYLFTMMIDSSEHQEVVEEFIKLRNEMKQSLAATETTIFDFDYNPSSINAFRNSTEDKRGKILEDKAFAPRLDMDKVFEMLKMCNAQEIQLFRYTFVSVYRTANIKDYLWEDIDAINELYEKVKELKEFKDYDKIQKLQIDYFEMNVKDIIEKLS
jgi:hypothetical protein